MRLHRKWTETKVVELVASPDLMTVAVAVAVAVATEVPTLRIRSRNAWK